MKVLILTASTGGGHNTTAKALKTTIENADSNATVEIVEALAYCSKFYNKFICGGYLFFATKMPKFYGKMYANSDKESALNNLCNKLNMRVGRKLVSLFEDFKPDTVISCHPFITAMLSDLKEKNKLSVPAISILTDFSPHRTCFFPKIDGYVISHKEMIKDILKYNTVSEKELYPLGIPVYEKFYKQIDKEKLAKELGFSLNKPTILFMAGSFGVKSILNYYKSFVKTDADCQCIVITGKNEKLYKAFDKYLNNSENPQKPTKLFQFVNNVEEYMHFADLVATKPGGLTVSESLACHLPMAIYSAFPGVEEGNANYLIGQNAAVSLDDNCDIAAKQLADLVSNPDKLKEMKQKCQKIAKPYSALNTYKLAQQLAKDKEEVKWKIKF